MPPKDVTSVHNSTHTSASKLRCMLVISGPTEDAPASVYRSTVCRGRWGNVKPAFDNTVIIVAAFPDFHHYAQFAPPTSGFFYAH